MDEPKKETVRVAPSPKPEGATAAHNAAAPREAARIVLPSRTPMAPVRRLPPALTPSVTQKIEAATEGPRVLPRRPPVTPPGSNSTPLSPKAEGPPAIRPFPLEREGNKAPPAIRGPRNETARISVLPRPTPGPPGPATGTHTQRLPIDSPESTSFPARDAIARPLAWTAFGAAAVIFLIQIWNYVVS
jgi:hypothetical protein